MDLRSWVLPGSTIRTSLGSTLPSGTSPPLVSTSAPLTWESGFFSPISSLRHLGAAASLAESTMIKQLPEAPDPATN